MKLATKIEAVLFYKSEPVSVSWMAKKFTVGEEEVLSALNVLENMLSEHGLRIVRVGDTVSLGTAPEAGPLIESIAKEELNKDLGKASLETLTIVLYRAPVSKSEIDYIRGVNSNFILRSLLIRGLVERQTNPEDQRSFLYRPTLELYSYLGITRREELPEYDSVEGGIRKFLEEFENKESDGNS